MEKSLQALQRGNFRSFQLNISYENLKDAVLEMLNLNQADSAEPIWKVLIYEQLGQEVISPLQKMSDLRENGITVHMLCSILLKYF
jgi:hypothetical protein